MVTTVRSCIVYYGGRNVKCRLCGALSSLIIENIKDYEHKTSGNWSYYQCRSCLVCQIDPFPTDIEEIASFYPDNYHLHHRLIAKGIKHRDAVLIIYLLSVFALTISYSLLN